MNNEKTTPSADQLSDDALETVAGGVIGVDTDGDGIIDGGCTDGPWQLPKPYNSTF